MPETCLQVGAEVHYILLWPLGGLAFVGHSSSPARDLAVAIAGPLTHIPQALVWVGILALSAHIVHYPWQHNQHVPDMRTHFWLAVCAGAAQGTSPLPVCSALLSTLSLCIRLTEPYGIYPDAFHFKAMKMGIVWVWCERPECASNDRCACSVCAAECLADGI